MHVFFPLETANRSVLADTRVFNDFKWQVAFLNAKEWKNQCHFYPCLNKPEPKESCKLCKENELYAVVTCIIQTLFQFGIIHIHSNSYLHV